MRGKSRRHPEGRRPHRDVPTAVAHLNEPGRIRRATKPDHAALENAGAVDLLDAIDDALDVLEAEPGEAAAGRRSLR